MKKILLLSIFLLNLLSIVTNGHVGIQQIKAQIMGSEVTLYPCNEGFDPTTGEEYWHFSTSPCNNYLDGTCVSVCRTCGMQGDCESMKYHSHGTDNSGGDNSYSDGNTQPSLGGETTIGGGGSSGGSTGSSTETGRPPLDHTLHIPAIDEKCIKYKDGKEYLPASYPEQDCKKNCFTTSMEYCFNLFRGRLDDATKIVRGDFENIYIKIFNGGEICSEGVDPLMQYPFLKRCGFDVQNVNFYTTDGPKTMQQAILDNYPIMATLKTDSGGAHEVVIIGFHESNGMFEAIDPGLGDIHTIDYGKITDAYIIKGSSSEKK